MAPETGMWHVINRGVERRDIVVDDSDRARFIHNLFAFNDAGIVEHIAQPSRRENEMSYSRLPLVDIHAFCLMNNHYHLLLSEKREHGISNFMHKLNMGYSKYFNEKYHRTGVLWQGKHKKILIERDAHFMYIPFYIHLNPLDFNMPEWREGKIKDKTAALKFLREYRWSSHLDYLGEKNFPSITERSLLIDILGTPRQYEDEMAEIISDPTLSVGSGSIEN